MRDHTSRANVEELLRHSQMELQWIQRQLAMISARNIHHHHLHAKSKSRYEVSSQQVPGISLHNINRLQLLEERNQALRLEVATLRQEKQQYRKLKSKLHAALQEKNRLNLELISCHLKASKYDQVRSDYEKLRKTFLVVSQERAAAQKQRSELQDKVENLEQVLKHMHESVELKRHLQTEHEQTWVSLHSKHKPRVQSDHEDDAHLLEVKITDLEQKWRSQTEHFHHLSKELLNCHLQSDSVETRPSYPTYYSQSPTSPNKQVPPVIRSEDSGNEIAANTSLLISGFSLSQPQTGDRGRPQVLPVKSSAVTTDNASGTKKMEDEPSPSPRSKPRYTGQVRLCTARYNYNPYDGPNEHPEAELPLVAGKYLYVYGNMDDDGFYEGELLDGQRGLVPSNFVEFVQDKEKPAILAGEAGEELSSQGHTPLALMPADTSSSQDSLLSSANALVPCSNGTGGPIDPEDLAEDVVPYPRKITLIKQLARSVIVAWEPPIVPSLGWGNISGYNVLVDGELRASIQFGARTKCLLEKLDLDGCVHRVSVQSVTDRGLSDELRCTLLVGANVVVAPYGLRVDDIQRDTAELSWLPSNSNYSHTVFLDGVEHAVVKPGRYRLRFFNLSPLTVYKVTVQAQPHQVPWQLPLEQRERKEAGVEFCTLAAGPPLPPQDVQVLCGQAPGVLQVHWKPPLLSPNGTSNGANVIGYAVCTKGQKIAEVMFPMADYVTVELTRIQCLEAREVIVRTLSVQGESQDSQVAVIPNNLLVPLPPIPLPPPMHPHPHPHPQPHLQSPHLPHGTPQLPAPALAHGQPIPPHPQHPHPRHPHPGGPQQLQLRPPHPHAQPLNLKPQQPHPGPRPQHRLPLLPHHQPHPGPQRPVSARDLDAKDPVAHHAAAISQPGWDPTRSPSAQPPMPMQGHTLEAPNLANLRLPSPQRILPQPRGTLIPDTVAKAIAREAAQRVAAESGKVERRPVRYSEPGQTFHQHHSDEEEEDEEGFTRSRRRGPSVDEFLRGSELGRPPHYSHSEEYHSESSRGSDLSDIMEEDEEELYSEMQLEEGRRRNSHNTPKTNAPSGGRRDRETGRRLHHGSQPQRRPLMVPSIEVTSENNNEGNLSPITEDGNYGRVARHRTRSSRRHSGGTRSPHDGYRDRDRRSPTYYEESEPEENFRIFVALFDYDPLSMSPNPDAADEELPFKEGQIIRVYGDKDTDGFYRAELRGRMGLVPCNMVSEIRAEDEETMDQLIKQGFLPLSTPVDRIEQRRGLRQGQASRRMVALYDYDPRESSPNVDVEAELTFCAGDILAVFGDIDEDGFYYGEMNGHRGLVPSNFLEEVPDDVEVYLTDTPSHHPQDEPSTRPNGNSAATVVSEGKRITTESTDTVDNDMTPVRAPSPIVRPLLPGTMRPLSPTRGPHAPLDPRDPQDLANKKKKGILSKGKKLLKRLSPVK
ncbi:RIMS-binding protein 2 isoform X2 [Synchiropus splendidus]|uniref:RIMS-binding protein 2 isoform X2 n=1 Tax=Synchiropus splendidus TaxID=270530 RepID=UPI00237DBC60|nr:RIMS-binding protein 2 isoform X2 [Synchiropus splendidus]